MVLQTLLLITLLYQIEKIHLSLEKVKQYGIDPITKEKNWEHYRRSVNFLGNGVYPDPNVGDARCIYECLMIILNYLLSNH